MISTLPQDSLANILATSEEEIAALKKREDFKSDAYQDESGNWTVGHGLRYLYDANGKLQPINAGAKITEQESDRQMRLRLKKEFEPAVLKNINPEIAKKLTQKQKDKLVSIAYNKGAGGFASSSFLPYLNQGDFTGAAREMQKDIMTGGKPSKGLQDRRMDESSPFMQEVPKIADQLFGKPNTDYGLRTDGTKKGKGYFGELKRPDGKISTELSIGVNFDGKEQQIPSLVPTLTEQEKKYLLAGNKPTKEIVDKAVKHARERIGSGNSPYADEKRNFVDEFLFPSAKSETGAVQLYQDETAVTPEADKKNLAEWLGFLPAATTAAVTTIPKVAQDVVNSSIGGANSDLKNTIQEEYVAYLKKQGITAPEDIDSALEEIQTKEGLESVIPILEEERKKNLEITNPADLLFKKNEFLRQQQNPLRAGFTDPLALEKAKLPIINESVEEIENRSEWGKVAGSILGLPTVFAPINAAFSKIGLTATERFFALSGLGTIYSSGRQVREAGQPVTIGEEIFSKVPEATNPAAAVFEGTLIGAGEAVPAAFAAGKVLLKGSVQTFKDAPTFIDKVKSIPLVAKGIKENVNSAFRIFKTKLNEIPQSAEDIAKAEEYLASWHQGANAKGSVGHAINWLHNKKMTFDTNVSQIEKEVTTLKGYISKNSKDIAELKGDEYIPVYFDEKFDGLKKAIYETSNTATPEAFDIAIAEEYKLMQELFNTPGLTKEAKEQLRFSIARLKENVKRSQATGDLIRIFELGKQNASADDIYKLFSPTLLSQIGLKRFAFKVNKEDVPKFTQDTTDVTIAGIDAKEIKGIVDKRERVQRAIRKLKMYTDELQSQKIIDHTDNIDLQEELARNFGNEDSAFYKSLDEADIQSIEQEVDLLDRQVAEANDEIADTVLKTGKKEKELRVLKGEQKPRKGAKLQPDNFEQKKQVFDQTVNSLRKMIHNSIFTDEILSDPKLFKNAFLETYNSDVAYLKQARGEKQLFSSEVKEFAGSNFLHPLDILRSLKAGGNKSAGTLYDLVNSFDARQQARTSNVLYDFEKEWKQIGLMQGTTEARVLRDIIEYVPEYVFTNEKLFNEAINDIPGFIKKYAATTEEIAKIQTQSGRYFKGVKHGVIDKVPDLDKINLTKEHLLMLKKAKSTQQWQADWRDEIPRIEQREQYIEHKIKDWGKSSVGDKVNRILAGLKVNDPKTFSKKMFRSYLQSYTGIAQDIDRDFISAFSNRIARSEYDRFADDTLKAIVKIVENPTHDPNLDSTLLKLTEQLVGEPVASGSLLRDAVAGTQAINRNVVGQSLNTPRFAGLNLHQFLWPISQYITKPGFVKNITSVVTSPAVFGDAIETISRLGTFRGSGTQDFIEANAGSRPALGKPGPVGELFNKGKVRTENFLADINEKITNTFTPGQEVLANTIKSITSQNFREGWKKIVNNPSHEVTEDALKTGTAITALTHHFGDNSPQVFRLLSQPMTRETEGLFHEAADVLYKSFFENLNTKSTLSSSSTRNGLGFAGAYNHTTGRLAFTAIQIAQENPAGFRNLLHGLYAFGGTQAVVPFLSTTNNIYKAINKVDLISPTDQEKLMQDIASGDTVSPFAIPAQINRLTDAGYGETLGIDIAGPAAALTNFIGSHQSVYDRIQNSSPLELSVWLSQAGVANSPISPALIGQGVKYIAGDFTASEPGKKTALKDVSQVPVYGVRSQRKIEVTVDGSKFDKISDALGKTDEEKAKYKAAGRELSKVFILARAGKGQQQLRRYADEVDNIAALTKESALSKLKIASQSALPSGKLDINDLIDAKMQYSKNAEALEARMRETASVWGRAFSAETLTSKGKDPQVTIDLVYGILKKQMDYTESYWISQEVKEMEKKASQLKQDYGEDYPGKEEFEAKKKYLTGATGKSFEDLLEKYEEKPRYQY